MQCVKMLKFGKDRETEAAAIVPASLPKQESLLKMAYQRKCLNSKQETEFKQVLIFLQDSLIF